MAQGFLTPDQPHHIAFDGEKSLIESGGRRVQLAQHAVPGGQVGGQKIAGFGEQRTVAQGQPRGGQGQGQSASGGGIGDRGNSHQGIHTNHCYLHYRAR